MHEGTFSSVEHPVQYGEDASAGMGVIDRGAEYKAVGLPGFFNDAVYNVIIEYTFSGYIRAGPAGSSVPHRVISKKQNFGMNSSVFQRRGNFTESGIRAAMRMGAAIEQ